MEKFLDILSWFMAVPTTVGTLVGLLRVMLFLIFPKSFTKLEVKPIVYLEYTIFAASWAWILH